jgi:transcriptional/translational regulatory protein YebC/TACO1
MAGHSHWSKIKRAKGATDAKRGKIWSKIARKIIIAAKNWRRPARQPQPALHDRRGQGRQHAQRHDRKAIKKGTGELGAENLRAVTYEATRPAASR